MSQILSNWWLVTFGNHYPLRPVTREVKTNVKDKGAAELTRSSVNYVLYVCPRTTALVHFQTLLIYSVMQQGKEAYTVPSESNYSTCFTFL